MLIESRRQGGNTLLEVLVAMLLLSIGLLSLAGLNARALQHSRTAQYRATAAQIAADYAERLRANLAGVAAGAYALPVYSPAEAGTAPSALTACPQSACTPAEMARQDVAAVLGAARAALPAGGLLAKADPVNPLVMDIWVLWQPVRDPAQTSAGTSLRGHCPPEVDGEPDALQCLQIKAAP